MGGPVGSQDSKRSGVNDRETPEIIYPESCFHRFWVECDISRDPRLIIIVVGGNWGFLDSTGLLDVSTSNDDFVAYT